MDIFDNSDLEYVVDDFHGVSDFEDDEPFGEVDIKSETDTDFMDSDFEDDLELVGIYITLLWSNNIRM